MPQTEINTIGFRTLISRAREASATAISKHTGNSVDLGIDGVAVLNLGFDDNFLRRGLTYQTLVLATSHTWTPIFFAVLRAATLNQAEVTLAHVGDILRPEEKKYSILSWREAIKNGRHMPSFRVFFGS